MREDNRQQWADGLAWNVVLACIALLPIALISTFLFFVIGSASTYESPYSPTAWAAVVAWGAMLASWGGMVAVWIAAFLYGWKGVWIVVAIPAAMIVAEVVLRAFGMFLSWIT